MAMAAAIYWIWRNETMGITKDSAQWIYANSARAGMFFATDVRLAKCPSRLPCALIGSLHAFALWTETSHCSRTAKLMCACAQNCALIQRTTNLTVNAFY
jgi:hypothetical protein